MAAGNFAQELSEELTCPVCLDYFTDPVTTDCEHNFCRACLTRSWRVKYRKTSCPLCRNSVQQKTLQPNPKLANAVEISTQFGLQVAEGARGVCQRHQEPVKLFCRDDKAPICVVCNQSEEHREHRVVPVEEAAQDCKGKIQAFLEKGRQTFVDLEKSEEQRSQIALKQLEERKQEITSAMEEMRRHVQEKERYWLRHLAGLEEEIKSRLEENVTKLSKETSHFSELIKDMELQSQQPPSEFLQHLGNILNRCLKRKMWEKLVPSPGPEWKFRSDIPKTAFLKKIIKALEGSLKQVLNEVSVTLDPDTAHPGLVLSKDLKRVMCHDGEPTLPSSSQRFDLEFGVLGREIFTSGRHCWEVEVEKLDGEERWAVGVAQESLARKGWIFFSPPKGVWAVGRDVCRSTKYKLLAYTFLVPTGVRLRGQAKRIQVSLDYERGLVEFFEAETAELIFTFPQASFEGEGVRPFFWVGSGVHLKC